MVRNEALKADCLAPFQVTISWMPYKSQIDDAKNPRPSKFRQPIIYRFARIIPSGVRPEKTGNTRTSFASKGCFGNLHGVPGTS